MQLYYVSSGLSFYFPYDLCLNRVSPLASYTLRYLPFFLAVIAIGVLLTIKYVISSTYIIVILLEFIASSDGRRLQLALYSTKRH